MEQSTLHHVFLVPNHKDLNPTLVGITNNPEDFITKFLDRRTQFKMERVGEELKWTGRNTSSDWSDGKPTMEGVSYARNQEKPPYMLYAKPVEPTGMIWLEIPYGSDAHHAL